MLVAPEEHPAIVQQLEEHEAQVGTVGWSDADRIAALKIAARNDQLSSEINLAIEAFRDSGHYKRVTHGSIQRECLSSSAGSSISYNPDPGGVQYWNNRGQQLAAQQQQMFNQQNANFIYNLNRPAWSMPR